MHGIKSAYPAVWSTAKQLKRINLVQLTTKQELRERILTLLKKQTKHKRLEKSRIIRRKLFAMPAFQKAQTIMFYASLGGEVETFEMMRLAKKLGKTILLPKISVLRKRIIPVLVESLSRGLRKGAYGIKEPKFKPQSVSALKDIDLVLVPALAFDRRNCRLGRGAGYYDRFLARLGRRAKLFGLAFDFQIVPSIPQLKKHDWRVHRVITG